MQRPAFFALLLLCASFPALPGSADDREPSSVDKSYADDPPPGFNDDLHEPPPSPIAREAPPMLDDSGGHGGLYDDPPNALAAEPKAPAYVTLSISPLHLLIPILELQAEFRVASFLGVAVLGGFGTVPAKTSNGDKLKFDAWEVGGQVVYYPSDDFRAWQLGVEVLYLEVNLDDKVGNQRVSGVGAGLAVGPLLGYKWISDIGFSLFLQGGFSVMVSKAKAKNDLGQSATKQENDLLLLLNVDVGWSF